MTTEEAQIPSQFTHSVKLEETAKGVRISVHVYGNGRGSVIPDAILTYNRTRELLEEQNTPLAPMNVEEVSKKQNGK